MADQQGENLFFVQFIHPGKEATKIESASAPKGVKGWCPWNRADYKTGKWQHRRKFLVAQSKYSMLGQEEEGLVGFWGEWEGPSLAVNTPKPYRTPGRPKLFHIPAFYEPVDHKDKLDTDPFVFGNHFLYCGCQQHTDHQREGGAGETFLRRLDVGSVILFGSSTGGRFVLDTCFVVGGWIDYTSGEFDALRSVIPPLYESLTLKPQHVGNPTCESFRLYIGATKASPVGDMYSFAPCLPFFQTKCSGFIRPGLEIEGLITQSLTQGKKGSRIGCVEGMEQLWHHVVAQIETAGLARAHAIELAPRMFKLSPAPR